MNLSDLKQRALDAKTRAEKDHLKDGQHASSKSWNIVMDVCREQALTILALIDVAEKAKARQESQHLSDVACDTPDSETSVHYAAIKDSRALDAALAALENA